MSSSPIRLEKAIAGLSLFVPALNLGPVGYERLRAEVFLGRSGYSRRLAPHLTAYRRQYFGTYAPAYERKHLIETCQAAVLDLEESFITMLERLAGSADVPEADVLSYCDGKRVSASLASWLLMRLCADRDRLRHAVARSLRPLLSPVERELLMLEGALLHGDWGAAAVAATSAAGAVGAIEWRGPLLEFAGLVGLEFSGLNSSALNTDNAGFDLLCGLERSERHVLDGVTAWCLAQDLLMRQGVSSEFVEWLSSVEGREFRQVDSATRRYLSTVARCVSGALADPRSVTSNDVRAALSANTSPLVWHDLAPLWIALAGEEGCAERALVDLDSATQRVYPSWERAIRGSTAFAFARLFLAEGMTHAARNWVRRGAADLSSRDALSSELTSLRSVVRGNEGEGEWLEFESALLDEGNDPLDPSVDRGEDLDREDPDDPDPESWP